MINNVEVQINQNYLRPRFIAPTDGHFFDINKNSKEETAKVILEELVAEPIKRVTNSDSVFTKNGIPQIEFSEYNIHARAEFEATQNAFKLAKDCNMIFWISPEDGGLVYSDGRFNIYFKNNLEQEIELKGKHMPLIIDRFKSLELGKRLMEMGGKTLGKVETVDDLRVQPVGFKLENINNWISECRKMMPEFEEFWTLFENGDDLKQEKIMKKHVEEAIKMANGDNKVFQKILENRGIKINSEGNHGSGYLNSNTESVLNFKIQMIGGEFYTQPVHDKFGKLICPVCGVEVESSSSACPTCKINFTSGM